MPTVPELIQGLDALLSEISSLTEQNLEVPLKEEKVEQWTRRVHTTLSNWGRGGDANRFSGADYSFAAGYPWNNLKNKIETRTRVLQVLRDDIAEHPDFWEMQFAPKPPEVRPILLTKPDRLFLGHGGNPLWSKVHIH